MTLRDELAAKQHEIWSHWMTYLFSKSKQMVGGVLISQQLVDHWQRQVDTDYKDLSPGEQESDLNQADKVLEVINDFLA